jgi:hypothetical protein
MIAQTADSMQSYIGTFDEWHIDARMNEPHVNLHAQATQRSCQQYQLPFRATNGERWY